MAKLKNDKEMVRGDIEFQYTKNVVAVKWFDNRGVSLVGTYNEGCDEVSKIPVQCPAIVKDYNSGMGSVDLLDQKTAAYKLDQKSLAGSITYIYFLI